MSLISPISVLLSSSLQLFRRSGSNLSFFPKAVKQIELLSPAKLGNAEYLVLAGCPSPFVDLEAAYKPRTPYSVERAWQAQ